LELGAISPAAKDIERDDDLIGHLASPSVAIAARQGNVLAHEFKQRLGTVEGVL
jgi:hypothetical protein